jgi:hypothetical protein
MGIPNRFLACGLILAVLSQQVILPLASAKAETTAHRIKRKLHKMERRTGTAFAHMGIVVLEEIFPPLNDADDSEETEEDGDLFGALFSFSFQAARSKPETHHQHSSTIPKPSTPKPSSPDHTAKKK